MNYTVQVRCWQARGLEEGRGMVEEERRISNSVWRINCWNMRKKRCLVLHIKVCHKLRSVAFLVGE